MTQDSSAALNQGNDVYPKTIMDLLPEGVQPTEEQAQLLHLIQGYVTLQNQFEQLTKHVEGIYTRLYNLEKTVANKILS